jgi:hypothetical protein
MSSEVVPGSILSISVAKSRADTKMILQEGLIAFKH